MRKQTKAREKYSNEKTRRYDGYAIAGRDGRLPSEATSVAESLPPDEPDPVKHGVSAIAAKLPPPCPSSSSPSLSVFPAQPRVALSVSCRRIPTGGGFDDLVYCKPGVLHALESCVLTAVLCVVSSISRENKKSYSLIWFSFSRVVLFVSLSGFVPLPF